jgi:hypothetical protein
MLSVGGHKDLLEKIQTVGLRNAVTWVWNRPFILGDCLVDGEFGPSRWCMSMIQSDKDGTGAEAAEAHWHIRLCTVLLEQVWASLSKFEHVWACLSKFKQVWASLSKSIHSKIWRFSNIQQCRHSASPPPARARCRKKGCVRACAGPITGPSCTYVYYTHIYVQYYLPYIIPL